MKVWRVKMLENAPYLMRRINPWFENNQNAPRHHYPVMLRLALHHHINSHRFIVWRRWDTKINDGTFDGTYYLY